MIVRDLLTGAIRRLQAAGIPDPQRDARLLLADALGVPADRLTLHQGDDVDEATASALEPRLVRRLNRQPVSQILGRRQFYGRDFIVTPDVLDPRPETETLVAEALSERFDRVLDLGTGSGCILLSLLAERVAASGVGVDTSPETLTVAIRNADALGLSARAKFRQSDWFSQVEGRFDLVVSNPPYIAADDYAGLDPEPRLWEPRQALTPGGDGLDAYRTIAAGAGRVMTPGARLLLEIGPTQAKPVCALLADAGLLDLRVKPDLDGRDRVISARNAAD